MKIDENIPFIRGLEPGTQSEIRSYLNRIVRTFNQVAGGNVSGYYTSGSASPTGGTWAAGDQVRNTAPAEAGTAGSKYVITGWICVTGGTPGTWKEMRTLTGA